MKTLLVLLGPTGVGKTDLSIGIAKAFGTEIISCDSRQIYKEMRIGTAVPSPGQLAAVRHHFIQMISVHDYYNSWQFEVQALERIRELFQEKEVVLMTGGSMLYIDAVCKGIDDIPTVTPEIRDALYMQFETEGLAPILAELKEADPVHYEEVDRNNYKRVIHAVDICRMTGKPYSSFRTNIKKERPFRIIKVGLNRDRDELCDRINQRVDLMMSEGLLEEARRAYPFRHLNSLNTVGYKELFNYFSGEWTLDLAVEKIKRNSRVYARKQMTWFKRDPEITWFHPDETEAIFTHLSQQII